MITFWLVKQFKAFFFVLKRKLSASLVWSKVKVEGYTHEMACVLLYSDKVAILVQHEVRSFSFGPNFDLVTNILLCEGKNLHNFCK